MSNKHIQKHVFFNQTHIDILDELIQERDDIKNYSEAIRFAVLSISKQTDDGITKKKINTLSKDLGLIMEMVSGGFHELGVKAIGSSDETYIYNDAKKIIENKIQRSTTIRSNPKKINKDDTSKNPAIFTL